jgi:very-short-patch-repair endonuclease
MRVEGKSVRPDMLIWVPSDESVRIIVECDGFQYHSNKAVFIHDRKRDRVLKSNGYEVLRYSGTEIFTDPVATSADLAEYLRSIERKADAFA